MDDSHFPTGYANGAMENQPEELCRSIEYPAFAGEKEVCLPDNFGRMKEAKGLSGITGKVVLTKSVQ